VGPEEFVRQFGGNRVINRVSNVVCFVVLSVVCVLFFIISENLGIDCQQWNRSCQVYAFYPQMGL
jgi:hypothetical protein